MAKSTDRVLAHRVIAPLWVKPRLCAVELAAARLLGAGFSPQVIAAMLDVNLAHVVHELAAKGFMYPDATPKEHEAKEVFREGFIFSAPGGALFYDAWLDCLDDIREHDIGEPCLERAELPFHYALDTQETERGPGGGNTARKFTEIGRREKECQT